MTDDAERRLLNELAVERRRFGYRRLREMARRAGIVMNLKKVYRRNLQRVLAMLCL